MAKDESACSSYRMWRRIAARLVWGIRRQRGADFLQQIEARLFYDQHEILRENFVRIGDLRREVPADEREILRQKGAALYIRGNPPRRESGAHWPVSSCCTAMNSHCA